MKYGIKKFDILIGIFLIAISQLLFWIVFLIRYFDLKYPVVMDDKIFNLCFIVFIISLVSYIIVIILNILTNSFKSKIIKILMKILIVLVAIIMLIETTTISVFSYICSYTTDINNYLNLELCEVEEEASTFFPTLDELKEENEFVYYYKHEIFTSHAFCVGLYVVYEDEQKFTSVVNELKTKFSYNEITEINDSKFKMRREYNINYEICESSILINKEKRCIIYQTTTTSADEWFNEYLKNK